MICNGERLPGQLSGMDGGTDRTDAQPDTASSNASKQNLVFMGLLLWGVVRRPKYPYTLQKKVGTRKCHSYPKERFGFSAMPAPEKAKPKANKLVRKTFLCVMFMVILQRAKGVNKLAVPLLICAVRCE